MGSRQRNTIIKNGMALELSSSLAETGVESGPSLCKLSEPINDSGSNATGKQCERCGVIQ